MVVYHFFIFDQLMIYYGQLVIDLKISDLCYGQSMIDYNQSLTYQINDWPF